MNRREFVKRSGLATSAMFCGVFRPQGVVPGAAVIAEELDRVAAACKRIAPAGWGRLMAEHGLNLLAADLKSEFLRRLPRINRRLPGFEDFSLSGERAIEPGVPSSSLLLHAFASPNVIGTDKIQLRDYPTLAEIDAVESLVFGMHAPSWSQLKAAQSNTEIGVAVFAVEYRPASKTPHGRHADLCFSRTAVARVGTDQCLYNRADRCFTPFLPGNPSRIRVLPSRFSIYLAVKVPGNSARCSVLNPVGGQLGDSQRSFWIPIHKLFSGTSCLAGQTLNVALDSVHVNAKLRNVHALLKSLRIDTGWEEPQLSQPPFKFTTGIACLQNDPELGPGVVAPIPHLPLISRAVFGGKLVSFPVVENMTDDFKVQMSLNGNSANTLFADITLLEKDGRTIDVSHMDRRAIKRLHESGFRAVHFVDYTGEGSVTATIKGLPEPRKVLPAASLVSAPDMLPYVDPTDISRWTNALPLAAVEIWKYPPVPLSDQRALSPPVLRSEDEKEENVTAVTSSSPVSPGWAENLLLQQQRRRISFMPDAASGLFIAGWDWGIDGEGKNQFFTNQWSSSPFAVDMALCGAQSYWPGTVPDLARWFAPFNTNLNSRTDIPTFSIAPLTDGELGITGGETWDGGVAPVIIRRRDGDYLQYLPSYRASYTQTIEKRRMQFLRFAQIDGAEFQDRVLAMIRVYRCLNVGTDQNARTKMAVLSFQLVGPENSELKQALDATKLTFHQKCYLFEICLLAPHTGFVAGDRPGTVAKKIDNRLLFFVPSRIPAAALPAPLLRKDSDGEWTVQHG